MTDTEIDSQKDITKACYFERVSTCILTIAVSILCIVKYYFASLIGCHSEFVCFFLTEWQIFSTVLLYIEGTVEKDISVTLNSPEDVTKDGPALKVEIINGTAFLVLGRPLDREGVVGPSSLTTNLICQKLATSDPGLVIPVSVR